MKESQVRLGVTRETISKWIANHHLPVYKVGRVWKFNLSEIDE
jgi:prophage CP4-57 regulatory protein (alpA)